MTTSVGLCHSHCLVSKEIRDLFNGVETLELKHLDSLLVADRQVESVYLVESGCLMAVAPPLVSGTAGFQGAYFLGLGDIVGEFEVLGGIHTSLTSVTSIGESRVKGLEEHEFWKLASTLPGLGFLLAEYLAKKAVITLSTKKAALQASKSGQSTHYWFYRYLEVSKQLDHQTSIFPADPRQLGRLLNISTTAVNNALNREQITLPNLDVDDFVHTFFGRLGSEDAFQSPAFLERYRAIRSHESSLNKLIDEVWFIERITTLSNPKSTVLDVGCCFGDMTMKIQRLNRVVLGVDHSALAIERAKSLHSATGLKFTKGSVETLGRDIGGKVPYNIVVSSLTLHSVRYIARALRELYKMVQPGGYLLISVEHPEVSLSKARPSGDFDYTNEAASEKHSLSENEPISFFWCGHSVTRYYRSIGYWTELLTAAGFSQIKVDEPTLDKQTLDEKVRNLSQNDENFQSISRRLQWSFQRPPFLFIQCTKAIG